MKLLPVLIFALVLPACATTGSSGTDTADNPQARVADTQPARLADATARELAHLARFEPQTLERVYPELRALAAALVGVSVETENGEAVEMPMGDTVPALPDAPLPPPPTGAARSLLHAVHLASYRREDMAARGWAELREAHAVLRDLDARLEHAHIPGQGDFLRLKAGPFDSADQAQALCRSLETAGQYCRAVDFTGQALVGR